MRIAWPSGAVLAAALFIVSGASARASELSLDVTARRARAMARLDAGSLFVLWSAPVQRYSLDINYEYRQDSNLYYLTGLTQDDTILVMMPGNLTRREILFIKDSDPAQEQWDGHRLTRDEATAQSGITTIRSRAEFDGFIEAMLSGRGGYGVDTEEAATFFRALSADRASLVLPVDVRHQSGEQPTHPSAEGTKSLPATASESTPANQLSATVRRRFPAVSITSALPLLADLRVIKTDFERRVLARSVALSSEAQLAGMHTAHPGAYEYTVKAAIEGAQRAAGALSWGYPSVVASGPNATVVHYPGSDRRLMRGDLLLADAAANVDYLSGDITRTYPVSGTFTPEQRTLYELVLSAQDAGIEVARQGGSLAAIHTRTVEVIRTGLVALGLITKTDDAQYLLWFMHGATHYIGIDVHDVGDRTLPLRPGMAFVIEPGIYIDPRVLDRLNDSEATRALVARIRPAVMKFAGLGIRIEDSFLVDDRGLVHLSHGVPRTRADVEAFLRARKSPAGRARPARRGTPAPGTIAPYVNTNRGH